WGTHRAPAVRPAGTARRAGWPDRSERGGKDHADADPAWRGAADDRTGAAWRGHHGRLLRTAPRDAGSGYDADRGGPAGAIVHRTASAVVPRRHALRSRRLDEPDRRPQRRRAGTAAAGRNHGTRREPAGARRTDEQPGPRVGRDHGGCPAG